MSTVVLNPKADLGIDDNNNPMPTSSAPMHTTTQSLPDLSSISSITSSIKQQQMESKYEEPMVASVPVEDSQKKSFFKMPMDKDKLYTMLMVLSVILFLISLSAASYFIFMYYF